MKRKIELPKTGMFREFCLPIVNMVRECDSYHVEFANQDHCKWWRDGSIWLVTFGSQPCDC